MRIRPTALSCIVVSHHSMTLQSPYHTHVTIRAFCLRCLKWGSGKRKKILESCSIVSPILVRARRQEI